VTNRHDSRSLIFGACVFIALACAGGILPIIVANQVFPDNGGYIRNVLFIRPPPGSSNPGYFVIVDEFRPGTTIDLVFHSYGTLASNASAGEATFDQNGTSMQMNFIGSPVTISNFSNLVYAENDENDSVNYIKVRPTDAGVCRLVTIITFANATIARPAILVDETTSRLAITVNGTDHFLFHPAIEPGTGSIDDGNVTISGNYCGYRVTADGLQWLLFANATIVSFKGTVLQDSDTSVSGFYNATANNIDFAGNGQGDPAPVTTSKPFNPALLAGLPHPYLLFNDSQLTDLRKKCNGTESGPWHAWYQDVGNGWVLGDAFKGRIEQNQAWIDNAISDMLGIDNVTINNVKFDWTHAQFIDRSTTLYPYLLAYDMVYNNMSATNRTAIEQKFMPKLQAMADALASNGLPTNNWRVVVSLSVGLGGLLFDNATWVNLAQAANDYYLNNRVRPNGPVYEGDGYGRYALGYAIIFYFALKLAGGYDYFTNPRFLKFLNYTVSSVSPLGWVPVFDDCAAKLDLAAVASIATCQVNATSPVLAGNLQWYCDFCAPEWGFQVIQIASYTGNVADRIPVVGNNGGFAYFDSGLAVFRSGWKNDSTYLVIANKNFQQSHVHLDENSIEIYALGKKFLTNPGYPGWAQPGQDYTISTVGSNTALLNNQGQLNVISDGFSAALQNNFVDYIVSPSLKAYASPFRLSADPALVIEIIGLMASLGVAGVLMLYLNFTGRAGSRAGSTGANRDYPASTFSTFNALFKFDTTTLEELDYRSRKVGVLPVMALGLVTCPSIIYFVEKITGFTAYSVNYVNLAPSIEQTLEGILPTIEIAFYALIPLVCIMIFALATTIHAMLFSGFSRLYPGAKIDVKEARGLVGKAWMLQCITMVMATPCDIFFLKPRFISVLHEAIVDTGNNISIGILIESLLSDVVVYLTILCAIALVFQILARKVLAAHARVTGKDNRAIKISYFVGLLVGIAILLAIVFVVEMVMYGAFSTIEIEHNPLM